MTTLAVLVTAAVVLAAIAVTAQLASQREALDWWVRRPDPKRSAGGDPRIRELRNLVTRADRGDDEATAELRDLLAALGARRLDLRLGQDPSGPAQTPPRDPGTPEPRLTIRQLQELVTDLEEM